MKNVPDCVVVSAGRSLRMGEWKPGLTWGRATVLVHTVLEAQNAGCRVIVAGGYRYRELESMLRGIEKLNLVRVRRWRYGMAYTVRKALAHVRSDSAFIQPADMPLIEAEDYRRLIREMGRLDDEFGVLRPAYGGKPGHPVLISQNVIEYLRRSGDGHSVRDALKIFPNREIIWEHAGVIQDIDTDREYERIRTATFFPGE